MLSVTCILLFSIFTFFSSTDCGSISAFNLSLPHQHPDPDAVSQDVQRRVNMAISRRQMLSTTTSTDQDPNRCLTGNPIDDCWRCDPNWANNRQHLADCAIGFGQAALGGKGGQIYVVSDPSDDDPADPKLGTLRYAVVQDEPLWIIFSTSMKIVLQHELIVTSYKTIDGRGASVTITGDGCISVKNVNNVIIHNIQIYECKPSKGGDIRTSPTQVERGGKSDGDGITILSSRNIWVDHCALSHCTDGLIDCTRGSTAITISNNYFSHHEKVMLLGHNDDYTEDKGMQVTVAFNHFGEGLVERMPRCRHGYIHVVNNDYTQWGMYAVGGSASPTINSQGNRYIAPNDGNNKEVTRRMDTEESEWRSWNWRTQDDLMVNGAFFVASGDGLSNQYVKASSTEPRSSSLIDQLTMNAGPLGVPRNSLPYGGGTSNGGGWPIGGGGGGGWPIGGGYGDPFGMTYGSGSPPKPSSATSSVLLSLVTISTLYIFINHGALLV